MDVEDLAPGQNFAQKIDQAIASCEAVLLIIGPKWMESLRKRSEEGQSDYVSHELESALAQHVTVVPVLVGGANMAQLTGLPKKLEELTLYQAAELRDSTFKEDTERLAKALKVQPDPKIATAKRKKLFLWIAAAAVLIGLLAALSVAGIGPGSESRARKAATGRFLATARTQVDQAEYESAFKTYQDALKGDPAHVAVMDLQVDAGMLWLQNFHVLLPEGQKAEDVAGPPLAGIISVLDAGLARTNGKSPRAADILAHLGWAHWLNEKLASKEFGPAAEQGLRRALAVDPTNVFANAMLGNWLLQTNGSVQEALQHFDVAVKTNQQRPLVRAMQLGGMIYDEDPGVRAALIKVANQMRMNGEPMEEGSRHRILSSYDPTVNSYDELKETLSAVPPQEAWATYLWLDDKEATKRDAEYKRVRREFIQAIILEIDNKPEEALAAFRKLKPELEAAGLNGRIATHVASAIKRLSNAKKN